VVVIACGTLQTPLLLLASGLANGSGELGKNLSIHPATSALALFDEEVNPFSAVPQGYAIEEFRDEGILFEGATAPLDVTAATLPGFGPEYVALLEQANRTLNFGFLVKDVSRGRVRPGRDGRPLITYFVLEPDRARLQRGMALLARMFLAAGAREVHPSVAGQAPMHGLADVEAFERARVPARFFDLSAYHPLGTARMGRDPLGSVVDPTNEAHDVHGLFVTDGSAVPTSLGVNPQVTIMALALRAAEHIDRRIERLIAREARG
jgi:choline dehydrogenase-like flavoprotein